MGKLKPWQINEVKEWAGMTKENHLIEYLTNSDPISIDNTVTALIGLRDGMDEVFSFMDNWGKREYDRRAPLQWECVKSPRTIVRCVGVKDKSFANFSSSATAAGQDGEAFYIGFERDWFFKGETLYGPHGNTYPMRVISEKARMIGNTAWYKVVPYGAKVQHSGIPVSELRKGAKYSAGPYFVGNTLSRQGGGVRHNTSFKMEAGWNVIRTSDTVAGGIEHLKLKVGLPVYENGKMVIKEKWIEKELLEVYKQFKHNERLAGLYGVSTRNEDGTFSNMDFSGEAIDSSDGLYEQMMYNGVEYYNTLQGEDVMKRILAWAKSICAGGKIPAKERTFTIRGGQEGIEMLSNYIAQNNVNWTKYEVSASDLGMIKKVDSNLMPNGGAALSGGYMFTEWHAPMGYRFRLEIDDWKDNEAFFKETINGVPASSYMFHVSFDGNANDFENGANIIRAVMKDGAGGTTNNIVSYQSGIRQDFNGGASNPYMSFDEDKSVIHMMTPHFAYIVKDVTAVKCFYPSIVAGV